jgi:hypothetical protein
MSDGSAFRNHRAIATSGIHDDHLGRRMLGNCANSEQAKFGNQMSRGLLHYTLIALTPRPICTIPARAVTGTAQGGCPAGRGSRGRCSRLDEMLPVLRREARAARAVGTPDVLLAPTPGGLPAMAAPRCCRVVAPGV